MGLVFDFEDGQTPLDEDEKDGLLIQTISNRNDLNEFEQQNIENAIEWTIRRKFRQDIILSEMFVKDLHKRMYGDVWAWAGKFRKTNKNIRTDKLQISIELKNLLDDTTHWIQQKTFEPDEIAIRFKHRLVSIHCFTNGNGRHSRLMADIIIEHIFKLPVFTWGAEEIKTENVRNIYLKAVKKADAGDYKNLILFARS